MGNATRTGILLSSLVAGFCCCCIGVCSTSLFNRLGVDEVFFKLVLLECNEAAVAVAEFGFALNAGLVLGVLVLGRVDDEGSFLLAMSDEVSLMLMSMLVLR